MMHRNSNIQYIRLIVVLHLSRRHPIISAVCQWKKEGHVIVVVMCHLA